MVVDRIDTGKAFRVLMLLSLVTAVAGGAAAAATRAGAPFSTCPVA